MSNWNRVVAEAPEFAARVRAAFDAGTNKTLATLRADGSPRVSGTELKFEEGPDARITLGMMPGSRKLDDVRRDPRVAVHSPTLEPPPGTLGGGDAKLAGVLVEFASPPPPAPQGNYFALDVTEVVLTDVDTAAGLLVIESWHPDRGHRRVTRA